MVRKRETRRSDDVQRKYDDDRAVLHKKHGDELPCPFCANMQRRKLESSDTMMVVRNDYPYEYFDGRYVKDHYMIIPRRHVNVTNSFTAREQQEYWQLLSKYQLLGYASFTRPVGDVVRTVPLHLHTHLFSYQD